MSQTLSIDQAVNVALNAYIQKNYQACGEVVEKVLAADRGRFLALFLKSLLMARAGQKPAAQALMAKLEEAMPALRAYDFRVPLIRRQSGGGWLAEMDARLQEFLRFQQIDAFILSYPKCGRTWLRMMLGKYLLNGAEGDPLELYQLTVGRPGQACLDVSHDDYPMWKPIDEMWEDKSAYKGKKVVWLIRDPRDTFVSYYFQHTRRKDAELARDDFSGSMGDFIHHPVGGLDSIIKFYNIWARHRDVPAAMHVVTYEDLHKDPQGQLKALIAFLGLPDHGDQLISDVVEYCKFENMREIEEGNLLNNPRLRAADAQDPEAFKVRKGKVGGYADYLSSEEQTHISEIIERDLDPYYARFGYVAG